MKPIDQGVSKDSVLYFHTASLQAVKAYFYILCTGHYQCNEEYIVNRNSYDSFLLMYIKSGRGCITINKKTNYFSEGQVVLIDCYQPHNYHSIGNMEILWLHFDGVAARGYYDLITNTAGNVIQLKEPYAAEKELQKIFSAFHHSLSINEALLAKYITNILTALVLSVNEHLTHNGNTDSIDEVLSYIRDHINDNLSLEQLAAKASLSPYYFIRVFKKETGFTPHEYIITARVNAAKFYLKASTYALKEICYNCGFSSESSFCTIFKKITGFTPTEFRNDLGPG